MLAINHVHQTCLSPNIHIGKIHKSGKGYISIAQKRAKWTEKYYNQVEMNTAVNDWSGNDIYTSQNSFSTKRRSLMNIESLENLYIDVDCYKDGFTTDHALSSVEYLADQGDIPYPNMIVMSGRGLQVVWNIIPERADKIPIWQQVENWLCGELKHLGADQQSTDVARVLRLCGSTHSENGNMVHAFYYHSKQFKLEELHEQYVPVSTPVKVRTNNKPATVKHLFTLHSLFWSRLQDIWHLVTIREGQCEGSREMILFLYRYHSCCFTSDPKQALADTLDLNKRFKPPLPVNEVVSATKSAERAFLKDKRYKYKTQKIVDLLDISIDEQKEMKNLIGKNEKQRRKNVKRVKHINKGKYESVLELYERGITNISELERLTGVTRKTIRSYIKVGI